MATKPLNSTTFPAGLQIAQILADLSDLHVADPAAALALVTAHKTPHPQAPRPTQKRTRSRASLASSLKTFTTARSANSRRSGSAAAVSPSKIRREDSAASSIASLSREDSMASARSTMSDSQPGTPTGTGLDGAREVEAESIQEDPDMDRARKVLELFELRNIPNKGFQDEAALLRARSVVDGVAGRYGLGGGAGVVSPGYRK